MTRRCDKAARSVHSPMPHDFANCFHAPPCSLRGGSKTDTERIGTVRGGAKHRPASCAVIRYRHAHALRHPTISAYLHSIAGAGRAEVGCYIARTEIAT